MNAKQLRTLLATVPDDVDVMIGVDDQPMFEPDLPNMLRVTNAEYNDAGSVFMINTIVNL